MKETSDALSPLRHACKPQAGIVGGKRGVLDLSVGFTVLLAPCVPHRTRSSSLCDSWLAG